MPPKTHLPDHATQNFRPARFAGYITQAEYRQYRDFYLGLKMLNGQADSLSARLLWAGLWLPLGIERVDVQI